MESVFGVPWDQLTPEAIEAFLEGTHEEPLTWEAKGHKQPHPDSVRKHACGFGNRIGGYLIVGAERGDDRRWSVAGVVFKDPEPAKWLDGLGGSLRPAPSTRARSWPLEGGRSLAVLEVEPVAAPPCMTPGGSVYERVSGATVPVSDPVVLEGLFSRGRFAREQATVRAREAAETLLRRSPLRSDQHLPLATLAIAAVGQPADASTRPFRRSNADTLLNSLTARLRVQERPTAEVSQDAVTISVDSFERRWSARITRDTLSAVGFALSPETGGDTSIGEIFDAFIPFAWKLAADRVRDLGGVGDARLAIWIDPGHPALHSRFGSEPVLIERPIPLGHPTDDVLGAVWREAHRSVGEIMLEPDDGPIAAP